MKKNVLYIVGIVVVVVLLCVCLAMCGKDTNKPSDDDNKGSTGLQVEENADDAEGDSIDFSEFEDSSEDKKDDKKDADHVKYDALLYWTGWKISDAPSHEKRGGSQSR